MRASEPVPLWIHYNKNGCMSIHKTTYIFISRNTYKMKQEKKGDSLQSTEEKQE